MSERDKIHYPIFTYVAQEVVVQIVADELIVLELYGDIENRSLLAKHFLYKISNNQLTKKIIPSNLIKFLHFKGQSHPCICCFFDAYFDNKQCLAVKMTIEEIDNKEVIHLSDFATFRLTQQSKLLVKNINRDVYLEVNNAFILFANILFEIRGSIVNYNKYLLKQPFDKKTIKEVYDKHTRSNTKGEIYQNELFCLEYFAYILEQLQLNNITPETIFRLNGTSMITLLACFDEKAREFVYQKLVLLCKERELLTINEQICYSILFQKITPLMHFPEFSDIYSIYEKQIRKLINFYRKPFPIQDSSIEVNTQDFFKEYLGYDFVNY